MDRYHDLETSFLQVERSECRILGVWRHLRKQNAYEQCTNVTLYQIKSRSELFTHVTNVIVAVFLKGISCRETWSSRMGNYIESRFFFIVCLHIRTNPTWRHRIAMLIFIDCAKFRATIKLLETRIIKCYQR